MVTLDRGGALQREDIHVLGIEPREIPDVGNGIALGTGSNTGYIELETGTTGDGRDVTTTDTTLTDPRLDPKWAVDEWVGFVATCNSKTMTVTGNTATVLTGAAWSGGGNPGNGYSYAIAGAETRTLPDPAFFGQILDLFFTIDAGDCVVTADSPINQNADTIMTFSDVGEHIRLVGQWNPIDGWEWRVICNDGVALT